MIKYIIQGYDGSDEKAAQRRQQARPAHIENIKNSVADKKILFAAAMLNEAKQMCGSTLIVQFESKQELDTWLENEPYVLGGVWKKIEVTQCAVPALFLE